MYHKTWWHMDGVWATVEESPDVVSEVVACFGRLFHFHLREKDLRKGVSFLSQLLWSLPLIILHKDRIRDHFVEEVQGFGVGHVILFLMTHCAIVRGVRPWASRLPRSAPNFKGVCKISVTFSPEGFRGAKSKGHRGMGQR